MGEGYIRFPNSPNFLENPPGSGALRPNIDQRIQTGKSITGLRITEVPRAFDMLTHAGRRQTQTIWRFGNQPITMQEISGQFTWLADDEEDLFRMRRAAHGAPVLWFPAYPIEDQWLIRANAVGATIWRTARRAVWDGATYTHAAYPPRVFVDATELTVITSGSPAAGEALVPDTQPPTQEYLEIETNTTDTTGAELLVLRYWPEYRVRFINQDQDIPSANALTMTVQFEERILAGFGGV